MPQEPQLTQGQIDVGVDFNPSKLPGVDKTKNSIADVIDQMYDLLAREDSSPAKKRQANIAKTELEGACMRAVKALTTK